MTIHDVATTAKSAVERFFRLYESHTPIGMILPSGWYRRPWDNYYNLRRVSVMEGLIEVDLSHGYKMSLLVESVDMPSRSELLLSGTDIRVSSLDSGQRYSAGAVRFVVAEQSVIVDRVAHGAASELESLQRIVHGDVVGASGKKRKMLAVDAVPSSFFLSSLESQRFAGVFACLPRQVVEFESGKTGMLVSLDPKPLPNGLCADEPVESVLLTARFEGDDILCGDFPLFVHIAVVDETGALAIANGKPLSAANAASIAWGEIYATREKAERHELR